MTNRTAENGSAQPMQYPDSLETLFVRHAGKVSDKWSKYLESYDRVFTELREKPIRLLEIGVQNGGSLEIWQKYFKNCEIVIGCDKDESCSSLKFVDGKTKVVVGDVNSIGTFDKILSMSDKFDIVIDDGSHCSSDIIKSFAKYFTIIEDGGVYVVEDLHCGYWEEFGGGLYDPLSSISFFKRLVDVINYEHWGLRRPRADALAAFVNRYNVLLGESCLASIDGVEFVNSLCFIRKRSNEKSVLGPRRIAGQEALVDKAVLRLNGAISSALDQEKNVWALKSVTMEEEIATHRAMIHRLRAEKARGKLLKDELDKANLLVQQTNGEIDKMRSSLLWRLTKPFRLLERAGRSLLQIRET